MMTWLGRGLLLGLVTLLTACNGAGGYVAYRSHYGPGPWGPYWDRYDDRRIIVVPPDRGGDLEAVPPIHYPEDSLEAIPPVHYPDIDMGMPDIDIGSFD